MQVANSMAKDDNDSSVVVKRLSVPLGLEELMESLTKQVLQKKPRDIYSFASHHFAKLLELRDKSSAKLHRDSSNLTTPPKTITLSDSQANILSYKSAIFATVPSRLRLSNKRTKEHEVYNKVGVDQKISSGTVQYSQTQYRRVVPAAVPSTLEGPTSFLRRQDNQQQKERQQQGRRARVARAAVDGRRQKGWEGQVQSDEVPIQAPVRRSSTERRKQYDKDLHNLRLRKTQLHSSEESIAKSDNSDSNHQHVKQKPPDLTNNKRKSRVRLPRGTTIRQTESFEVLDDNICIDGNNITLTKNGLPNKAKGKTAKIVAGVAAVVVPALMLDQVQESNSEKGTDEDNRKSNIDNNHPSKESISNVTDINSQDVKALEDFTDTSTEISQENLGDNIYPTLIDTFETVLTNAEKTIDHMKDEIVEQEIKINETIVNEIEVFNEAGSNCIDNIDITSNNLIEAATTIADKAKDSFDAIVLPGPKLINENVNVLLAQEIIKDDVVVKDSDVFKKIVNNIEKMSDDLISTEPAVEIIESNDENVNAYNNIQVPLLPVISNDDTIGIDEIDKSVGNISSDIKLDIKDSTDIKNDVVTTTEVTFKTIMMESLSPRDKPTTLNDISSIPVVLLTPDQISPRNEKNESNVSLITATVVNSAKNIISGSLAAADEEIAKILLEFNEMQTTQIFLNKELASYNSEKSDVEYTYIPLRDYSLEKEDNSNEQEMQSGENLSLNDTKNGVLTVISENLEDGRKEVVEAVIEIDSNINGVEESVGQEIDNEIIQSNKKNIEKLLSGNNDKNIKSFVTEDINTTEKINEIVEKLEVDQTAKDTFFGKEVSPRVIHEECLVSKSNRAATQIQSAWRGHRTRKTLACKHLQKTEECDELPEHRLGSDDALSATIIIQAFLRGHLVRKTLRQGNVSVIDSPEKCHILEEILEEPEVEIMAENDQRIVKLTDEEVEEALKQLDAIKGPKQFESGNKSPKKLKRSFAIEDEKTAKKQNESSISNGSLFDNSDGIDDVNLSRNKIEVANDGINVILFEDSVIVQNQDSSENTFNYNNNTKVKPIKESLNASDSDNISLLSLDSPSKDENTLYYEMAPTRPLTSENTEPIISKLDSQLLRKSLEIVESTNEEPWEDLKLQIPDSRNIEIHDSDLDVFVKDDELTNKSYEEDVSTESQESINTVIMAKETFESVTPESDISNTLDEIDDSEMDVKESFNDMLQNDNSISPVALDINEKLSRYHDLNIRHDVENSEFIEELSTVNIDSSELEQNLKNSLEYENNNTIIIQTENSLGIPEHQNIKILADIISAATKIQSLYRGYKVRAKTYTKPNGKANIGIIIEGPENNNNAELEDKNKIYDDVIAKIEAEQYEELHKISGKAKDSASTRQSIMDSTKEDSATTIQKHYKGHRVRRDLAKQRAENMGEYTSTPAINNIESVITQDENKILHNNEEEEAALVIQKHYKRFKTRRGITEKLKEIEDKPIQKKIDDATNIVKSENKILRNDEEENAALTIQKHYKGFKVRRDLAGKSKQIEDKHTLEPIDDVTKIVNSENKILQNDDEENATLVIQKDYNGFEIRHNLAKQSEVVEDKDALEKSPHKVENTTIDIVSNNKISQIMEEEKAALPIQKQDKDYKIRNAENIENLKDMSNINEELPQLDSISNYSMKEIISNSTLHNANNKSDNPSIQEFIDSIIETNVLDMPIQHPVIEELNNTEKFIETSQPIIEHSFIKRDDDTNKSSVVIEEIIDDHDDTEVKIDVEINEEKPTTPEDKVTNVQGFKDIDSFGDNIEKKSNDSELVQNNNIKISSDNKLNRKEHDLLLRSSDDISKSDLGISAIDKIEPESGMKLSDVSSSTDQEFVEGDNIVNVGNGGRTKLDRLNTVVEDDIVKEAKYILGKNDDENINSTNKKDLEQKINVDVTIDFESHQDSKNIPNYLSKSEAIQNNNEKTNELNIDPTSKVKSQKESTERSVEEENGVDGANNSGKNVMKLFDMSALHKEILEAGKIQVFNDNINLELVSVQDQPQNENHNQYNEMVQNKENILDTEDDITSRCENIVHDTDESKKDKTNKFSTEEIEDNDKEDEVVQNTEIGDANTISGQDKEAKINKERRTEYSTHEIEKDIQSHENNSEQGKFENEKQNKETSLSQIDDEQLRNCKTANDINNDNMPDHQDMNRDSDKNEVSVKEIEDRKDSNIEEKIQPLECDGNKETKESQNDFDESNLNINKECVDENATAILMELHYTADEQKNSSNNAEEIAAIAIQKHYKGYKVRKGLSVQNEMKQVKNDTEDDEAKVAHNIDENTEPIISSTHDVTQDELFINNQRKSIDDLQFNNEEGDNCKLNIGIEELEDAKTSFAKGLEEMLNDETHNSTENKNENILENSDNTGLNEEANVSSGLQESITEQIRNEYIQVHNDQIPNTMELSSLVQNTDANESTTSNIGNENHDGPTTEDFDTQSSTADKNKQEESEEIVKDFETDATKDFEENRRLEEALSDDLIKIVNNNITQESKEFTSENAIQPDESDISKGITISIAKNDENIVTSSSNEKEEIADSSSSTLGKDIVMKAKDVHLENKPNEESILDIEDAKGKVNETATVTAQPDKNKSPKKNEDKINAYKVNEIDSQIDIIDGDSLCETNLDKNIEDIESKDGRLKDDEVINSSPNNENVAVNTGTEISEEKPTNEDTDKLHISEDIIATQNASSQQNPEIPLEYNVLATANILPQDDITNEVKDDYEEVIGLGDKAAPIDDSITNKPEDENKSVDDINSSIHPADDNINTDISKNAIIDYAKENINNPENNKMDSIAMNYDKSLETSDRSNSDAVGEDASTLQLKDIMANQVSNSTNKPLDENEQKKSDSVAEDGNGADSSHQITNAIVVVVDHMGDVNANPESNIKADEIIDHEKDVLNGTTELDIGGHELKCTATALKQPKEQSMDSTNEIEDFEKICETNKLESNQCDKEIQKEKPTTVNLKDTERNATDNNKNHGLNVEESIQLESPNKTAERKSNLETTDGEQKEQSIIINENNFSAQDPIFETKSHSNSFEEDMEPDQNPDVNEKETKSEVGGTDKYQATSIISEIATTRPPNDVLQSFSAEQQETFAQLKSKSEEIETQLRNSLREIETFTKEQLQEPFYLHDPKRINTNSTTQYNPIARVVQIAAGTTHTTTANIELLQTAASSKANSDAIVKFQEASVGKPLYVNVDSLGDIAGPILGVVNPEDIKDGRLPVTLQLCQDGDADGPPGQVFVIIQVLRQ